MSTTNEFVLPSVVRPASYAIRLEPDLERFTFNGEETVAIHVAESVSEIVLNAIELEVHSAALQGNGASLNASDIRLDAARETVTLDFGETVAPGRYDLALTFTGTLNDKLHGFYRSQYTGPDGEPRYMAATQFEATDARRAFPCWDEPECKATFQVTLAIPTGLKAISNTPVEEESQPQPGVTELRFAETPVMSTYLLAFVVGDLIAIQGQYQGAGGPTQVAVWTTPGKEEQGRFALDTSVSLLSFFNDYFGIPYPLEKLDHIALPDFAAGAMENWGAITYREIALLVDEANSSAGTRQRVAEVVAHEMAHMWFGDLVTMQWWDDLWLNESFASWMGTKAVDWLFPEWEMWTQFVNMDTTRALSLDGLKNSHPIEQEVNDPAEVSQLFDAISYSKGASIIRMLEQFLGAETFRQGLREYIAAHQYGNARTQDLWSALESASGQPVTSIMDTWTKQMGYPVLQVEASGAPGGRELTVSQERFVYDRLLEDRGPEPEVWPEIWKIPVRVSSGGDEPATIVMDGRQASLPLEAPAENGDSQWFKINPEQTGFFRVNYQPEDWDRLIPAIKSQELSAADRLGIQNDAYSLSKSGHLPITRFLALAQAYGDETDASVWGDLSSNLRDLEVLLTGGPVFQRYQAFARSVFKPAAARVGWEARSGEGHLDALLRSIVLSQAGSYGDQDMLAQASELFEQHLQDRNAVRPDLRGVVFSLAAQAGDRAVYDQLWELEKEADLQEEKMRLLLALSRFEDQGLLTETLARSLSSDVRLQDTISVVSSVAANPRGRQLAWDFLKSNWPEFDRRYGTGGFGLMRLVAMCGSFTTQQSLDDVETFFAENPAPAADRTILQSVERIRLNVKWLERNQDQLAAWLDGYRD